MPRLLRLSVLLLLTLGIATAPVRIEASKPRGAEVHTSICPLSEVRAGQIAVGKSVFRGTKIESFRVKIIGVLPKYDGSRSLILGRILDGTVVVRKSGAVGGMSGSPVYINGRLAGAVSMTWAFSKEPIAGITPIESMLEAWEEPKAPVPFGKGSEALATPVQVNGRAISQVRVSPGPPSEPDPPGMMTLMPLGGLVQVSGFNQRGIERAQELLAPYGLRVAAGGAGAEEKMRPLMVPGAAVGARLIGGDFNMTALGTATMVEGGRVLAFGHPLFERGDVDLPMTGGYVYDILPSTYMSNKIMVPTQVIGRVTRDCPSAIAGTLGGKADMLPVTIEVADLELGRSRVFHIEVARLRDMMPGLVAAASVVATDEVRGRVSRGMARVRVEIDAEGRTITREDSDYSPMDAAAVAAPAVLMPLNAFTDSSLGAMRLDRVRIRVETMGGRRTAVLERITVDRTRVRPGDEVTFTATIHPYGQPAVDIPLKVRLPADLPKGQLRVTVSAGSDADQARGAIGAPRPAPVTLDQLVERYMTRNRTTELVLQVSLPRGGASLSGEELPNLPGTAMEALSATKPTDLRPLPSVLKIVAPTDWVLAGRQMLQVPVESPITAPGAPSPGPREAAPEEEQQGEETGVISLSPAHDLAIGDSAIALGAGGPDAKAKPATEEQEKKETALTRAADTWTENSAGDYELAKLVDVALADNGALTLSLEQRRLAAIPADVVWSVVAREGAAYVGTGKEGRVFRVSPEGKLSEFAATGEMNVHALAFGPDGSLYAGTSPRGKVFRIDSGGRAQVIFDSDSTYIWALVVRPDGAVYAGAGSPGRIYEIRPDGRTRVLAELPVSNVLSLALGRDGELYAGTSDGGLIFRVAAGGAVTNIGQVPGASVNGLPLDDKGNLYATCSPGGQVYRVTPGGEPELYLETGEQTAFGLALLPDGTPVVATGPKGLVVRGTGMLKAELLFTPESGLATAIAQDDGALYVGTSGPSVLWKLGPEQAGNGLVESDTLDAERVAKWGRVSVSAETPEGTRVAAETRSGDSPIPDDGWSAWTPTANGAIASPPARYLQYRLALSVTPTGTSPTPLLPSPQAERVNDSEQRPSPVVRQVTISRRPQNRRPQVVIRSPAAGQRLSCKAGASSCQTIKWQAQDPDKDLLTFTVELRSMASPTQPAEASGANWLELAKGLKEPKYDWDTSKQTDGQYLLKVTASDGLSRPDDPMSDESVAAIWVDNTAPSLLLFSSSLVVDEERRAKLSAMASDQLSPIRSVEYRVDEGEWQSVATDAVESLVVAISITTDPLPIGKHKLSVRAFDAAGNLASESTEVEVV